jgi:hypothetical protein
MGIQVMDLKIYGSEVMPEDDVTTQIGGNKDSSRKPWFVDPGEDALQAVSSDDDDDSQEVEVTYRSPSGVVDTLIIALTGQTPATNMTTVGRVLKAVKSGTTEGDVALEGQTAVRTGTAVAGGPNYIDLDAGASAVDQFYRGMIIRLTGGAGQHQIAQIVAYGGTLKRAYVNADWDVEPDNTSDFRISKGCFFDKTPDEIMEVRRPFYGAAANAPGGGAKDLYELVYLENSHATDTLLAAVVLEGADPSGRFAFGVGTAINTPYDNGEGNDRTIAPAGVSFDSDPKPVPGDQLEAGDYIAVWLKYSLTDGDVARDTTYSPAVLGLTS